MNRHVGLAAALVIALALGCGCSGQGGAQEIAHPIGTVEPIVESGGVVSQAEPADAGVDAPAAPSDVWPADLRYELRQVAGGSHLFATPGDIDLGAAPNFMARGLLDLCGPVPSRMELGLKVAPRPGEELTQPRDRAPVVPVSVVLVRPPTGQVGDATLVVVSLRNPPVELGRLSLPGPPTSSGVSAAWKVVAPAKPGSTLRFELRGRSMPGPGGGMPGPEVVRHLEFPQLGCSASPATSASPPSAAPATT